MARGPTDLMKSHRPARNLTEAAKAWEKCPKATCPIGLAANPSGLIRGHQGLFRSPSGLATGRMGLIRGPKVCLETFEVWPSMGSPKAKPKVMYVWLDPSKDCSEAPEATVHRSLSTGYSGQV